jgi:hypothetical protein
MDAKLEHRVTHRRVIPEPTEFSRTKPSKNARLPDRVAEGFQPRIELGGSEEDGHSECIYLDTTGQDPDMVPHSSAPCVITFPHAGAFRRIGSSSR